MNKKSVFIGLHIPKTAGTSLLSILQENLSKQSLHQTTSLIKNANLGVPFVEEMKYLDDITTIFGHEVDAKTICYFPNRRIYLFTFIREPISRLISHYKYQQRLLASQGREQISINNFIESNKNQICRFIVNRFHNFLSIDDKKNLRLHKKAIKILQSFDFVGTTEYFDSSVGFLLDDMGIDIEESSYVGKKKNITKKSSENLEKDIDSSLLKSENKEDCKLYEFFIRDFENNHSNSEFIKNPLGFQKKQKMLQVNKMLTMKIDENKRLRYLYYKAANEYKNNHQLEKFIEEQKQLILRNALKLDCMISCLEEKSNVLSVKPKIHNKLADIIDKENV